MADAAFDIWFVLEVGVILGLMASLGPLAWWLHKWRRRNHVFQFLKLSSGRWIIQHAEPDGPWLRVAQGPFLVQGDSQAGTFKGHPLFIHRQGDSYPITLETNRIPVEVEKEVEVIRDGKPVKETKKTTQIVEITNAQTAHISERHLATLERARVFGQIYGGAPLITLLLIIILVLVFIGIIVNVVR